MPALTHTYRSLVDESVVKVLQGREVGNNIRPVVLRFTHRISAEIDCLKFLEATQVQYLENKVKGFS